MMQRKNKPKPSEGISIDTLLMQSNNDDNEKQQPKSPLLSIHLPDGNANGGSSGSGSGNASGSPSKHACTKHNHANCNSTTTSNTNNTNNNNNNNSKSKVIIAHVKSNTFGTSPFDKHWLNLDCCGIVCATLTYMLHLYGVYAFGWILIPPWMGVMSEDGVRTITFAGYFHRTLFIAVALLAVFAHFKAMTTDPGAVPPDANPIPDPDELESLIKGEQGESPTRSTMSATSSSNNSSLMMEDTSFDETNINANNGVGININSPSSGSSSLHYGNNNNNGHGLPQAANIAASGVAMAAIGAAAAVGAAGVAVASAASSAASAAAPIRARQSPMPSAPRGKRMCRRCHAYKPPRAHHCSICKRCIIKMDHHCPWVNNCVGIGNHKYFLLFIFYTSLSCMYSLIFVSYRFFHCIGRSKMGPRCVDHPNDLLPLVGLVVEALLFGLFTICMMVDQWDVVMTNLTHIDRLKGAYHHGNGPHFNPNNQLAQNILYATRRGINEVFGTGSSNPSSLPTRTGFHATWLSPLHKACFPDSIRDDIFGYCRPCSRNTPTPGGRIMQTDRVNSMEMVGRGDNRVIGAAEIV